MLLPQLNNTQSGFVALLSTIIIGAVLLVMTIEAGRSGFYTRYLVLGTEAKAQSRTLAEGCGKEAFAKFLADSSWLGDATNTNEIGTCYIYPLLKQNPSPQSVTVRVRVEVGDRVTNFVLEYDMGNLYLGEIPRAPLDTPVVPHTPQLVRIREVAVIP